MTDTQNEEVNENEELKVEETIQAEAEVVEEAEDNVEELKTEEPDYKSKYFYLAAEMDNMRKRFDRDRDSFVKYGNEKILKALLDVMDNFDRSIDAVANEEDEKVKNFRVGVEMVRNQFGDVLKNNGLEEVKCLGEQFDPNFHEALAQQPAEGKEENEVINEYQKGYILNGRLLRAAKVVIAKNV
jgi:molecular chaperone GrpE